MAGFSQYTQQKLIDHLLKTAAFTVPTNIYVALYTTPPTDTGGGTEESGTGYSRVVCNSWNAATAATPSVATNSGIVSYGNAGGSNWATVSGFGLFDTVSGGNLLGWATVTTPKTINSGDAVSFAAGAIQVTLD